MGPQLFILKRLKGEPAQGGNGGNKNEVSTKFLKNTNPVALIEFKASKEDIPKPEITCSKSTMETLEQYAKSVQRKQ